MATTLTLNKRGFDRACERAQVFGAEAIAAHMQINRSTYRRVRSGQLAPGPRFIASALAAFPAFTFEELFTIATKDVAA